MNLIVICYFFKSAFPNNNPNLFIDTIIHSLPFIDDMLILMPIIFNLNQQFFLSNFRIHHFISLFNFNFVTLISNLKYLKYLLCLYNLFIIFADYYILLYIFLFIAVDY